MTSPRHQTGCALARQNQSRGLLDPGRPHRPLRLSRSFSRRCEHTPCPPRLRLPEAFRANWSKHNSLEGTEQLHRLLSIRRARDKPALGQPLLICPARPTRASSTKSSFLSGFRAPCREGRSVMGVWSMPALPSAKPGHHPQGNHNLKYRGTTGINQWRWGLGSSTQTESESAPCISQTRPEALRKGLPTAAKGPCRGGSQPLAPPAHRLKGEGSVQPQHHALLEGPQATDRPRGSSCRAPLPAWAGGVPQGSRCGDWPGARGEGWGRGGGGWISAVPCSETPTVTSVLEATATRISSLLLEAASKSAAFPPPHARPSAPTTQSAQRSKVQSKGSLAFVAIGPGAVERCSPIRDGLLVPGDLGKGNTVVGFNMDL